MTRKLVNIAATKLMTFKEFQAQVREIKKVTFQGTSDSPLHWGIERAKFNEQRLLRLIAVAEQVPYATARRRYDAWQRQLSRVRETRERMERMDLGIYHAKVTPPSAETIAVAQVISRSRRGENCAETLPSSL